MFFFSGRFIGVIADNCCLTSTTTTMETPILISWFIDFKVLKFYNAFRYKKNKERLKLLEKASKNCKSITNIFEKACDKTPILQDSSKLTQPLEPKY